MHRITVAAALAVALSSHAHGFPLSTSQLDAVTAGAAQVVKPAAGKPQTVKGLEGNKCQCGKGSTVKGKK